MLQREQQPAAVVQTAGLAALIHPPPLPQIFPQVYAHHHRTDETSKNIALTGHSSQAPVGCLDCLLHQAEIFCKFLLLQMTTLHECAMGVELRGDTVATGRAWEDEATCSPPE
jgi:hypothetical protein